eukprot:767419-Hanusia_phi.AAC.6
MGGKVCPVSLRQCLRGSRRSTASLAALADSRQYPLDRIIDQNIKPVELRSSRLIAWLDFLQADLRVRSGGLADHNEGAHSSATRNSWIPSRADAAKSYQHEPSRAPRTSDSIVSRLWQQSQDTLRHASQGVFDADYRRSLITRLEPPWRHQRHDHQLDRIRSSVQFIQDREDEEEASDQAHLSQPIRPMTVSTYHSDRWRSSRYNRLEIARNLIISGMVEEGEALVRELNQEEATSNQETSNYQRSTFPSAYPSHLLNGPKIPLSIERTEICRAYEDLFKGVHPDHLDGDLFKQRNSSRCVLDACQQCRDEKGLQFEHEDGPRQFPATDEKKFIGFQEIDERCRREAYQAERSCAQKVFSKSASL